MFISATGKRERNKKRNGTTIGIIMIVHIRQSTKGTKWFHGKVECYWNLQQFQYQMRKNKKEIKIISMYANGFVISIHTCNIWSSAFNGTLPYTVYRLTYNFHICKSPFASKPNTKWMQKQLQQQEQQNCIALFVIPFQKWLKTNEMRLALFKWLFYRHRAHNQKLKQKMKNEIQFFFFYFVSMFCEPI